GGWVHHDMKPANVLLGSRFAPLLSDFGTARRIGEASPPGSLGYVSPERLAGRSSDPRDDVYGLGRIIEDALDVAPFDPRASLWRRVAEACTGAHADRPPDAAGVLALVG
ncbi:MAG: protein kinase domain-containing protein, partial [Polyangiaceae bacterium]